MSNNSHLSMEGSLAVLFENAYIPIFSPHLWSQGHSSIPLNLDKGLAHQRMSNALHTSCFAHMPIQIHMFCPFANASVHMFLRVDGGLALID